MNQATIFGSLADDKNNFDHIFDILKQKGIKNILVGGYNGQLKEFCEKSLAYKINVTLAITKQGKKLGFGSNRKVKEIAVDKYFDKKSLLYSSSDLFIFLPVERIGLGLLSEIVDLLEYSIVYCSIVKLKPPKILFVGKLYEVLVNKIIDGKNNKKIMTIEYVK